MPIQASFQALVRTNIRERTKTKQNKNSAISRSNHVGGVAHTFLAVVSFCCSSFTWTLDTVKWGGCGGTLIHEDIVLTAAHCAGICTNALLIGAYKARSTDHGAEWGYVEERLVHPYYNTNNLRNDFMILKLKDKVRETNTHKCLFFLLESVDGSRSFVFVFLVRYYY